MTNFFSAGSFGIPRASVCLAAAAVVLTWTAPASAETDIEVWHALQGTHKTEFEKLVKQFNREQSDVDVSLKGFDSFDELIANSSKAKSRPHLVQLADNHSPEVVAESKQILPLYKLLASYPIKDQAWFLPQTSSFVRDGKGNLLAFPFMAEVPVMFYNIDAYKKAGLDAANPGRTWPDLQGDLIKLRASGLRCPYGTSQQVAVHFENLAPINRKSYASASNGLAAGQPALQFDSLFMRHLSMMVSWKRSQLFTQHSNGSEASAMFVKGECGVLTAGSSALGDMLDNRKLKFGVAPLPYYDQVAKEAGAPFVSGSALWTVAGHPKAEDKATMAFLAFLSKPVVAAEWHQKTGFLPLTAGAFKASDVSFYERIPGAHKLVASMSSKPLATSRGFRLRNYSSVEALLTKGFDEAMAGNKPPVQVLSEIKASSSKLMH